MLWVYVNMVTRSNWYKCKWLVLHYLCTLYFDPVLKGCGTLRNQVYMSVHLPACQSIHLSTYLSDVSDLSVCLSIHSLCLHIFLAIY